MQTLQLPGFDVIERAGKGATSTVWKARQVSLDRIVALKVLDPDLSASFGDVTRFLTEARIAAKLKHPCIVQVYDAGVKDGLYYFVMEFVAGYSVDDWIRRKKALEEQDALLVAECVARALEHAWQRERIIHCDIKPDNVMVDADGTIKVCDLGIARTLALRRTAHEVMGTPSYMAPEQIRGDDDLDFRTDIYALGATIYHMVTGKAPFEGHEPRRIYEMHCGGAAEDPAQMNPRLSEGVVRMLRTMMAKDRNDRYADWSALREDLTRVQHGRLPSEMLAAYVPSTVMVTTRREVPARVGADTRRAPVGRLSARSNGRRPEGDACIRFSCPACRRTIEADPALAGERDVCPVCGRAVAVPRVHEPRMSASSAQPGRPGAAQARAFPATLIRAPYETPTLVVSVAVLVLVVLVASVPTAGLALAAVLGAIVWVKLRQGCLLGQSVLVSAGQFPGIHASCALAAKRLCMAMPAVFVHQSPTLEAFALGFVNSPTVVIHSALVEALEEDELLHVIGHELAHVKCHHTSWQAITGSAGSLRIPVVSDLLAFAFLSWSRKAEYTCDRGGLVCSRDLGAALSAMGKLAVGKELFETMELSALLKQKRLVDERLPARLAESFQTHPHLVNRMHALVRYFGTPEYARAARCGGQPGLFTKRA